MKKIYLLLTLMVAAVFASAQCDELFFSEYAEGSSNNKYMEIYNPGSTAVDLSNYSVFQIGNGGNFTNTLTLSGMLAPNDVYVFCADQADASILAEADTALSFPSVAHYSGDDCMMLLKGTDTIDQIGTRWVDPGSEWTVGSGSTKEYTLVRKKTIDAPDTAWATTAVQGWDVYAQNTWSYLGSHESDCYVPAAIEVGFSAAAYYFNETDGTVEVEVNISNPDANNATSVDVTVSGGSAVNGTDYTATSPTTLTFPAGSSTSQKFSIMITDNSMAALDKDIALALSNATNGAIFTRDSVATVNIENDDYLVADIKDVRSNDADLAADNEGLKVEVTGVVYGIDYDGNAGISFTIIDNTDGINIFNFRDVNDYVVVEGDEITVRGEIDFYNGLTEVFADSIKVNSSGNTLVNPTEVEKPSEETESKFIQLRKVWVADTTTVWPNNGNVWLTNEDMDTFQIRIDRDIPGMVGLPVPFDTMTIIGIGGQFDNSAPYDEGYQIFPRGPEDVKEYKEPVSVQEVSATHVVLYPNPASTVLYIKASDKIQSIKISSLNGQEVIAVSGSASKVDLSGVAAGVYVVEVKTASGTAVKKLSVR